MDKNEELQKWLNDDRYVRIEDMATFWNHSIDCIRGCLRKHTIKPKKQFFGRYGRYAFYNKKQCYLAIAEWNAVRAELRTMQTDNKYVRPQQLTELWGISSPRVAEFLQYRNIQPVKKIHLGPKIGNNAFYDRAECERARPFINQPEQKEVEKVEEKRETKNKQLDGIFCGDIALGKFVIVSSASDARIVTRLAGDIVCPVLSTKTPDANYDYIKKIIGKDICLVMIEDNDPEHKSVMYWLNLPGASPWIIPAKYGKNITEALDNGVVIRDLIKAGLEDLCKGFYAGSSRKIAVMPEPTEQTPDIIPADTIDLFTMSELESELKQRGVELTAEVRAKINASDMPEMQHIATMLRGNTKTIAIRLSVLNEIAGQLREVKRAGFNWDKWLNPEIEKKEQVKESALDPEPVFNTEYAKEMFYLLKEVDKNIDNEDIPCEIKEIKKVFARHGSINAAECRSVLKKHGYVGMTDAGYLLGMSYAEINSYQKLFLPDYLITLGYDTMAKYKNGRCTSPIWNKTRVDKHFEEIKKNNDFRLDLVKSEISRMGENSRDRLLKMSELDKTSVSEKLDRIISAAWIMGNYDKK